MSQATAAELQQKLLQTKSELQAVKSQLSALRRSEQLQSVTQAQVHEETDSTSKVWQSTGKMFMAVSVSEYDENIEARKKDIQERISALDKKEVYFATTLQKLTEAIVN